MIMLHSSQLNPKLAKYCIGFSRGTLTRILSAFTAVHHTAYIISKACEMTRFKFSTSLFHWLLRLRRCQVAEVFFGVDCEILPSSTSGVRPLSTILP